MEDLRQTEEWARFLASDGWKIAEVKGISGKKFRVFMRKFPLSFSFIKIQRFDEALDLSDLKQLKKENHTLYSILEPSSEAGTRGIAQAGYRVNKSPYLPTKTRVIDLSQSENKLIKGMSENFQRILEKLKNSRTQELKIKKIKADDFYEGWQKWAPAYIFGKGQFMKIVAAFGKKTEFWAVAHKGNLLSAIMLLFTADSCFYFQTWTSKEGREKSPHVFLVWETIKRAKKLGKKFYNFEGIQDERFPLKNWEGFSEFKRRFGGYEVAYPGSYTKWA